MNDNDLIRRGDAIEAMYMVCDNDSTERFTAAQLHALRDIPAIEVPHYEWIEDQTEIICPKCHARFSDEIVFMNKNFKAEPLKFCPECGACMIERKENVNE